MVDYQVLLPSQGKHNLENYDEFARSFTWESVEKEFSWWYWRPKSLSMVSD